MIRAELGHSYDRRLRQAQARAEWELGDESWAMVILRAYFRPDEDQADLQFQIEETRGDLT